MKASRAQAILFVIFLASLVLQILIGILSYVERAIIGADLSTLTLKLLAIYSVPLAVILAGIFAKPSKKAGKAATATGSQMTAYSAIVLAAFWNVLLLARSLFFGYAVFNQAVDDNINQLVSFLDTTSTASSFLIAGALAFFFTKQ